MKTAKWRRFSAGIAAVLATTALAACSSESDSNELPPGAIELTVPYSAGGPTDAAARALAEAVNDSGALPNNRVQVVNRAGGNTSTAASFVAGASPDGTTLGFFSGTTFTLVPLLGEGTYNPDDLEVSARVATSGVFLGVQGDAPWQTLDDLLAAAKANPNDISVGNAGTVSQSMAAIYAIEQAAGVELREVGFKGSAPAATALLGGDVDGLMTGLSGFQGQIDAGEIRPLFSLANERDPALPDVPSATEAGLPDIFTGTHYVLALPKGVSTETSDVVINAFLEAADSDEYKEALEKLGSAAVHDDAAKAKELLETEIKWYEDLLPKICDADSDKEMCDLWQAQQ